MRREKYFKCTHVLRDGRVCLVGHEKHLCPHIDPHKELGNCISSVSNCRNCKEISYEEFLITKL